jgi:purine-binding chemotaxis protein CheW
MIEPANINTPVHAGEGTAQLVTVHVGDQLFGIPILQVRDVFIVPSVTPVPLAPTSVAGLFNLRGRVITMLSVKAMLGQAREDDAGSMTAIGIEWQNEAYGLLVDRIGEVLTLDSNRREPNPTNLDTRWATVSAGVFRLDGSLLVEISLEALFRGTLRAAA